MRRGWVLGVMLLAACGGSSADGRPDAATRVARAKVVTPVLLGHDLADDSVDGAAKLTCELHENAQQRAYFFAALTDGTATSSDALNTYVAGELTACPRSDWGRIAREVADAADLDIDIVQPVVDEGVQALTDAGL